jgi:hypothetical protein
MKPLYVTLFLGTIISASFYVTIGECYYNFNQISIGSDREYCKTSAGFRPSMIVHLIAITIWMISVGLLNAYEN